RPKPSQLWARADEAGAAVKRLLVDRFYNELVDTVMAQPQQVRELALFRLRRLDKEISNEEPELGMDLAMMAAAEIAPDLPRKVLQRLGWGPAALALLN